MSMPASELRRRILTTRGVVLEKHTKRPIKVEDLPDQYPKTDKMKYFEQRCKCKLERIILTQSLSKSVEFFQQFGHVDRSTISRWRKHITKHLGLVTFKE